MLFFVIQWLERHIRSRHEIDLLRCDRESKQWVNKIAIQNCQSLREDHVILQRSDSLL